MPLTGLYFLPTNPSEDFPFQDPFQDLVNKVTNGHGYAPLPRWSLKHHLFRGRSDPAPSSLAAGEKPKPSGRYLQMLAMSHCYPEKSYVIITAAQSDSQPPVGTPASSTTSAEGSGKPGTLVAFPAGEQSDDFLQLVSTRMSSTWEQRPSLSVSDGRAFRIGEYVVRVGEVRQGTGSGAKRKGIAMEVEWAGGQEGDWAMGEAAIRAFWHSLGLAERRGVVQVAGVETGEGRVRQWMEVLSLKGWAAGVGACSEFRR